MGSSHTWKADLLMDHQVRLTTAWTRHAVGRSAAPLDSDEVRSVGQSENDRDVTKYKLRTANTLSKARAHAGEQAWSLSAGAPAREMKPASVPRAPSCPHARVRARAVPRACAPVRLCACACARARVRVRARVCACARACARVRVRVCACARARVPAARPRRAYVRTAAPARRPSPCSRCRRGACSVSRRATSSDRSATTTCAARRGQSDAKRHNRMKRHVWECRVRGRGRHLSEPVVAPNPIDFFEPACRPAKLSSPILSLPATCAALVALFHVRVLPALKLSAAGSHSPTQPPLPFPPKPPPLAPLRSSSSAFHNLIEFTQTTHMLLDVPTAAT
eukprot:6174602-Pleurochrysis_carterae.AAC.2